MMKLKVKHLHIQTGRLLVVLLHAKDAKKYDLHGGDRVKVTFGKKSVIALIDITNGDSIIKPGTLGFMHEVSEHLNAKNGSVVSVNLEQKPLSVKYIRNKMLGETLTPKQIHTIIKDIAESKLSDIELTYFVAASISNNMTTKEIIAMTKSMVKTGDVLKLRRRPILDKHCIGGVAGNRTSMIVVPILASMGITIPKTSSRSITSAAGTADTVEVLCEVTAPLKKMRKIVEKTNGSLIWGGGLNFAPADDKIIIVERPINIDTESQLIASILAKKHSVGSTHILIDIPIGRGAKLETAEQAKLLENQFLKFGRKLGKHIKVIVTDGSEPVGNGIGPALEARDVLWLLKRDKRAPIDLEEKSLMMAEIMAKMAGVKNPKKRVREALEDGSAYEKMIEIIEAQGKKIINPNKIKVGKYSSHVYAKKSGTVKHLDNTALNKIARVLGAPVNKGAGIYLYKKVGEKVKKGEKLFTLYSESTEKLKYAKDIMAVLSPVEM